MAAIELNLDSIVGPTHNYAGLSYGNIASVRHGGSVSSPRQAALEGLTKMKYLADLGLAQGVLPPQERPDLVTLRRLGFAGSDGQVVERAAREAPHLLAACYSASSMWAANAATVSPGADCADGRVHFTAANLLTQFHRALEPTATARALERIFADRDRFAHHAPLPAAMALCDEGAANHMRLCRFHGEAGVEVFVFGREAMRPGAAHPARYPARQTREACEAIARLHGLDPRRTLLVQQSPQAIDAGVFHNDVVAVSNQNVLLCHENAFADQKAALGELGGLWRGLGTADELVVVEVTESELSLADAVRSYVFNSQLVTLAGGTMALVCPSETRDCAAAKAVVDRIVEASDNPISQVHYLDVRQSMNNGGGPACLRLRVVLSPAEQMAMQQSVLLSDQLYTSLIDWINRHYREQLGPGDLGDPRLVVESRDALDELARMLGLGAIYPFQRDGRADDRPL